MSKKGLPYSNTIQGGYDPSLDAALVKGLMALEPAVDADQYLLQTVHVEAAQAVAENIVPETSGGSDPLLQLGFSQIRLQLQEAGQAEQEAVKQRQQDGLGANVGIVTGVGEILPEPAKVKDFVHVPGKGGELMGGSRIWHSKHCNNGGPPKRLPPVLPSSISSF